MSQHNLLESSHTHNQRKVLSHIHHYFLTGFSTISFTVSRSPFLQAHTNCSPIIAEKNEKIPLPFARKLRKERDTRVVWRSDELPTNPFKTSRDA